MLYYALTTVGPVCKDFVMSDKQPGADRREASQRSGYLATRVKELQSEMKSLQVERKELTERLKAMPDMKSPEAKVLKLRRVYLTRRPTDLKVELSAAVQERQGLATKLRA